MYTHLRIKIPHNIFETTALQLHSRLGYEKEINNLFFKILVSFDF